MSLVKRSRRSTLTTTPIDRVALVHRDKLRAKALQLLVAQKDPHGSIELSRKSLRATLKMNEGDVACLPGKFIFHTHSPKRKKSSATMMCAKRISLASRRVRVAKSCGLQSLQLTLTFRERRLFFRAPLQPPRTWFYVSFSGFCAETKE